MTSDEHAKVCTSSFAVYLGCGILRHTVVSYYACQTCNRQFTREDES